MNTAIFFGTILAVVFSVVITWVTSLAMLRTRNIKFFLPFLLVGVIYSTLGASVFHQVFNSQLHWNFLKLFFVAGFFWIFINLQRRND